VRWGGTLEGALVPTAPGEAHGGPTTLSDHGLDGVRRARESGGERADHFLEAFAVDRAGAGQVGGERRRRDLVDALGTRLAGRDRVHGGVELLDRVGLANCDFARGRESALVDAKGVKRSCWGSANLRRRGIRPPGLAARAVLCVCQEIAFRLFT
jgi:hypothetical protein